MEALAASIAEAHDGPVATAPNDPFARRRDDMVERDLVARGIVDERVLDAMRSVPRHHFVDAGDAAGAYGDHPIGIGHGQTISQPYIVALTAELARVRPTDRVLDVGAGSGYAAAVLARLAAEVWAIEVIPALAHRAAATLADLGIDNVHVRTGDGWGGLPEEAPFDVITVAAAAEEVPAALTEQLADGGRLVVPVGERHETQRLLRIERHRDRLSVEHIIDVRFVPLVQGGPTPGDPSTDE